MLEFYTVHSKSYFCAVRGSSELSAAAPDTVVWKSVWFEATVHWSEMFNGSRGDGGSAVLGHCILGYAVQQGTTQAHNKQTLFHSDWLILYNIDV